jgi:hypothetical protein
MAISYITPRGRTRLGRARLVDPSRGRGQALEAEAASVARTPAAAAPQVSEFPLQGVAVQRSIQTPPTVSDVRIARAMEALGVTYTASPALQRSGLLPGSSSSSFSVVRSLACSPAKDVEVRLVGSTLSHAAEVGAGPAGGPGRAGHGLHGLRIGGVDALLLRRVAHEPAAACHRARAEPTGASERGIWSRQTLLLSHTRH